MGISLIIIHSIAYRFYKDSAHLTFTVINSFPVLACITIIGGQDYTNLTELSNKSLFVILVLLLTFISSALRVHYERKNANKPLHSPQYS